MNTYSPISTKKEESFELNEPTLNLQKAIHELQCAYPGVSLEERKQICASEKWKPENKIPELSQDVRISVSSLQKLVEKNEKKQAQSHADLKQLCKDFASKNEPVESIDSETYWYELSKIIFKDFDLHKKVAGELNFRIISEAYSDFFGV
ncbi:MAG: hypothetical protein RLO03_13970 [Balneola sp.]